jgi:hypothetical protein
MVVLIKFQQDSFKIFNKQHWPKETAKEIKFTLFTLSTLRMISSLLRKGLKSRSKVTEINVIQNGIMLKH